MMKRDKSVVVWVKLAALCVPLLAVVSCAGDPETVPMRVSPWEELTQPLGLNLEKTQQQNVGPLGNTSWVVTNINPKPEREFKSMIFKFQGDGNLVETTVWPDGSEKSRTFPYSAVGSTLLIVQQKGNVNARFKMQGKDLLMIDAGDRSILLQRIK